MENLPRQGLFLFKAGQEISLKFCGLTHRYYVWTKRPIWMALKQTYTAMLVVSRVVSRFRTTDVCVHIGVD